MQFTFAIFNFWPFFRFFLSSGAKSANSRLIYEKGFLIIANKISSYVFTVHGNIFVRKSAVGDVKNFKQVFVLILVQIEKKKIKSLLFFRQGFCGAAPLGIVPGEREGHLPDPHRQPGQCRAGRLRHRTQNRSTRSGLLRIKFCHISFFSFNDRNNDYSEVQNQAVPQLPFLSKYLVCLLH